MYQNFEKVEKEIEEDGIESQETRRTAL